MYNAVSPTLLQLAAEAASCFTTLTRPSGQTLVTLKDGSPDWVRDLVHKAHGAMMPDDHRYAMVDQALDTIAELTDGDDAQEALSNVEPPVYTSDLTRWLASSVQRVAYCDEAADDLGAPDSLVAFLQYGWTVEFNEVASSVLTSLEQQTAEMTA